MALNRGELMKKTLIVLLISMTCNFGNAFAETEEMSVPVIPNASTESGSIRYNGSLYKTLAFLCERYDVSYDINDKIEGNIAIKYPLSMPLEDILNDISRTHKMNWAVVNGRYIFSASDIMTMKEIFKFKYINKDQVKEALKGIGILSDRINVIPQDSTVTIDGTYLQILKAKELLQELDQPVKQVTIQMQFIEVSTSDAVNAGFKYSMDNVGWTSNQPWKPQLTTSFNAERIFSNGKTLSRPTVTTLNGKLVRMEVVTNIPVFTTSITDGGRRDTSYKYEPVGLISEITPTINDDNEITLEIDQNVSSILRVEKYDNAVAPVTASRKAKTIVRVKTGETAIIGGLIQDNDRKNMTAVPLLSQIPILGEIFKYHENQAEKTELFIYITARINDGTTSETGLYKK